MYWSGGIILCCTSWPLSRAPPRLSQIEPAMFDNTLATINEIFMEAEELNCATYCEGCLACLTAYCIYTCMDPHYDKVGGLQTAGGREDALCVCVCRGWVRVRGILVLTVNRIIRYVLRELSTIEWRDILDTQL